LRRSVIELAAALIVEPGNHVVRLTAAVVIDLDAKQGFAKLVFTMDFIGFYGDLTVI
jgi:hypothetical protein